MLGNWWRHRRAVQRLQKEQRADALLYARKVNQAKARKADAEELSAIAFEAFDTDQQHEDLIAQENHRHLMDLSGILDVPTPDWHAESEDWEESRYTRKSRLTHRARTTLLADIRRERDARWASRLRFLPIISALTGLLGVVVAIIALLIKSGHP